MIIQTKLRRPNRVFDALKEGFDDARFWLDPYLGFYCLRNRAQRHLGYRPNLREPKSYNEKILWRKAFDRNPDFPIVADKVAVRDYVRDKLGEDRSRGLFAELYQTVDDPDQIDFSRLPESYVVKANHACAWNIFVTPDSPADEDRLRREAARWLSKSFGKSKYEWAYLPIKRRVLFEEMLEGPEGGPPRDIKFAVFNGKCRFIVYIDGRFGDHCWYHMTPEWTRLLSTPPDASANPDPEKPEGFDDMLALAEAVSAGVDYFRVDFMLAKGRFVMNELTLYDAAGFDPLDPPIWDQRFGDYWDLPKLG